MRVLRLLLLLVVWTLNGLLTLDHLLIILFLLKLIQHRGAIGETLMLSLLLLKSTGKVPILRLMLIPFV